MRFSLKTMLLATTMIAVSLSVWLLLPRWFDQAVVLTLPAIAVALVGRSFRMAGWKYAVVVGSQSHSSSCYSCQRLVALGHSAGRG